MAKIHIHGGGNLRAMAELIKRTADELTGSVPHDIRVELAAGKPQRQAVAIALATQRRKGSDCGCERVGDPAVTPARDEWEESKHPRADNGQFGSGGGGASATNKPQGSSKEAPPKSPTLRQFEAGTLTPAQVIPKALMAQAAAAIEQHGGGPEQPKPRTSLSAEEQRRASDQLSHAITMAKAVKPSYDYGITQVAREVGGVAMLADIKGGDRLLEKHVLENGSDPSKMRDLVRSSIVVNSEADVKRTLEAIKGKFEVTRIKDRFASPLPTGYRDMLINVKLPGGIEGEIQVHVPQMIAAKKIGHKLYDVERKMPAGAEKTKLQQLQSSIYSAALQQQ